MTEYEIMCALRRVRLGSDIMATELAAVRDALPANTPQKVLVVGMLSDCNAWNALLCEVLRPYTERWLAALRAAAEKGSVDAT